MERIGNGGMEMVKDTSYPSRSQWLVGSKSPRKALQGLAEGAAANELGCSQGYIFNVLKANGLRLRDGGFYWTGESDLTAALIISHTHTGACQVDKM